MLTLVVFMLNPASGQKRDLVLGTPGNTSYQLVIPEDAGESLEQSAELIRKAFDASGINLPVVTEMRKNRSKPGIYLGDTEFARDHGIDLKQFKGWGYLHRVIGEDLVIAGTDRNSRMGVVKGVCDFLHEYAGTRFLYPGETGIEFLPVEEIAVPADLDQSVIPVLKFNFGSAIQGVDFYSIANNQFPGGFRLEAHSYAKAVPPEKYFETHPEYFALLDGERRENGSKSQYCISDPDVRDLIVGHMLENADNGYEIVSLGQPDAFRPCECEACHALYGTGDDWIEKLWLFHRDIVERFSRERPDTDVLLLSYQYTTHPPKTIQTFPENAIILLTHIDEETFGEWNQSEVPGGYAVYIYNWGTYNLVGYLPKKSPEYLERQTRRLAGNHVTGIFKDGVGSCYGLEGPAYYVFGRMFDDTKNLDAGKILEEYYAAAFREAVDPMRNFFRLFHRDLEFHSEWLGPRCPAQRYIRLEGRKPAEVADPLDWVRNSTSIFGSRGVVRFIPLPEQMLRLVFTPGLVLEMEEELKKAEALAGSEKVGKRLHLIRLEFDYLKNIVRVLNLYHAYLIRQDQETIERLLVGIETWNELLDTFYETGGSMKPIPGWPELALFRGHGRSTVGLITLRHWPEQEGNPFAWDTEYIRKKFGR